MTWPSSVADLLERGKAAGLFPGAVAMWGSSEGTAPFATCGVTSLLPEGDEADLDTWYDLASLTKPLVTGTLCALAFREGELKPGTLVRDVMPEVGTRELGRVTVSELLTHTSGLPAWVPLYVLAGGDPRAAVGELLNLDLVSEPGAIVEYSCPGFILLGRMLEKVFGLPLDRAFAECVSEPLGLGQHLVFTPGCTSHAMASGASIPMAEMELLASRGEDQAMIPQLTGGAPDDGNARFLGGVAGNAGLFGSARGVFRLALEMLGGDGSLLGPEELGELTELRTGSLNLHRAWAWQLASSPGCSAGPALSQSSFGHTGFTGTSVWVDPQRDQIFVLLTNRHHPSHRATDLHPLRRRFHDLACIAHD